MGDSYMQPVLNSFYNWSSDLFIIDDLDAFASAFALR